MWYNGIMRALLRSPLHGLVSRTVLLLEYTGRKSGQPYSTPLNYALLDDTILITSFRHRTWWRNLRGGQPVTVRLRGRKRPGTARVLEEPAEVVDGLTRYLTALSMYARYYEVELDEENRPVAEDVARAVERRVIIEVALDPETGGSDGQ